MDSMAEDGIHMVVIMSSAQVGKTEVLLNAVGYYMDQDPSPMLFLAPTLQMAEATSKDRVAPMVRDTPALTALVKDPKSRDSSNTLLHKKFPGGHLTLCGANSPASLASRPIRVVLGDEIDRYPVSAGTEGDPLQLANKRTTTFHNRLTVVASTPTVKGASRIEMAFEASDQRHYYVPCPHCGTMQSLAWSGVKWDKDDKGNWDGGDPWYECESCETAIKENNKAAMLRSGRWMAESYAPGVAGFHLNELYSPWRKWSEVVADFIEAKKDTELLRVFVNTSLGETFEDDAGEGVESTGLFARRERYAAEVPAGALALVAGVDTQDDRLEVSVYGFGIREEQWLIEHTVLWGDPGGKSVWAALDDVLLGGKYQHESGSIMGIAASCIDSGGHHTKRVYEYVRTRKHKRVFAIKGVGGFGKPVVSSPSRKRHGRDRRPVDLFTLGVDEIKSLVFARLNNQEPGPGFIHFPIQENIDEEFFDQLTAEVVVHKMRKGVPYREWKQIRKRNEALDCAVYAYAAFTLLRPNMDALKARIGERTDKPSGEMSEAAPKTRTRKPRSGGRGGFVNRWK